MNPEAEIAAAHWPKIRMILVHKVVADRPLSDVQGTWAECTPESMAHFSAAAYFFGREIHQKVGVPVGLVGIYYGGSNGQSWVRREALDADPDLKAYVTQCGCPLARPAAGHGRQWATRRAAAQHERSRNLPLPAFQLLQRDGRAADPPGDARGDLVSGRSEHEAMPVMPGCTPSYLPLLITDWRAQWGAGDFPFLFVQLPGLRAALSRSDRLRLGAGARVAAKGAGLEEHGDGCHD